jgi:glutamate N-acetyltransferase/amino-acid N-acetyltransferase
MLAPAMATMLAVLTTDARSSPARCTRARSARSTHVQRARRRRVPSTNDTVLVLANGAPATSRRPRHAYARARRALTAACADLADQMAPTPKARPSSCTLTCAARARRRGALAPRGGRVEPARAVLALRRRPYWGRVLSELGASGAFSIPSGRHRVQRRTSCAATASRRRTTRPRCAAMAGATSRSLRPARGTARRRC